MTFGSALTRGELVAAGTCYGILDTFSRDGPSLPSDAGYHWQSELLPLGFSHPLAYSPGFDPEDGVGHRRWDNGDTNFVRRYGAEGGVVMGTVSDIQFDFRFNEASHFFPAAGPSGVTFNAAILIISGPALVGSGSTYGTTGNIFATVPFNNGLDPVRDFNDFTGTEFAGVTPAAGPIGIGEWWTVRYYSDMTVQRMKAWRQGTPEPAAWDVDALSTPENGHNDYPTGSLGLWVYVDTSIDNLRDRQTFYAIDRRIQCWESFYQEYVDPFTFQWEDSGWTIGGTEAFAQLAGAGGTGLIYADFMGGTTTAEKIATGGEFSGDFNLVIEFIYGAVVDTDWWLRFKVHDGGASACEVELKIDTAGHIGFVGGSGTAFTWPSTFNATGGYVNMGAACFLRWVHSGSGDTLKVWEQGRAEPSAPQVSQGPSFSGGDRMLITAESADDLSSPGQFGGWAGIYLIDPTGDGSSPGVACP